MSHLSKISCACLTLLFAIPVCATTAPSLTKAKPSVVYVTQDVSTKSLKKIYKKLAPVFAGEPTILEFAPDSFLFNGDDSILATEDSPNALMPDLSRDLPAVLGNHSNLYWVSARDKNSPVTKWHEFRFLDCLCYDDKAHESFASPVLQTRCQALNWYPTNQCRHVLKMLSHYKDLVTSPKTLVVLSKAKIQGPELRYSGAIETMFGGTFLVNKDSSFNPFLDLWVKRITNPQKRTFFISVLSDIPGPDGELHQLGIVGSEDFFAAQREIWKRIMMVNPNFQFNTKRQEEETWLNHMDNELFTSLGFNAAIRGYLPEGIYKTYHYKKYDKKEQESLSKRAIKLHQKRTNNEYRVVTLD